MFASLHKLAISSLCWQQRELFLILLFFSYCRITVQGLVHILFSRQVMEYLRGLACSLLLAPNQGISFLVGMIMLPRFLSFSAFFVLFSCPQNRLICRLSQLAFLPIHCCCLNRLGNHTQSQSKEKDGQKKSIRSFLRL